MFPYVAPTGQSPTSDKTEPRLQMSEKTPILKAQP